MEPARDTMATPTPLSFEGGMLVGVGDSAHYLTLALANRHGLIAGATGTGKTVTLQGLAEGFSRAGVPVFMADVKGDLAGIAMPGGGNAKIEARLQETPISGFAFEGFPTLLWDLFGTQGAPMRTTISEFGPVLLSRILDLSEAQSGMLQITFKLADEQGWLLLDLKDLHAVLTHVEENAKTLTQYGLISKPSIAAIRRALLTVEQEGAAQFFGEPALQIGDLLRRDVNGRGFISLLAADRLMASPTLYASFLLWLLSELYEELPEVGDLPQPKLVFFFDEAHLLFEGAPKALQDKIEQMVRLIRSKGVGVYFVTQSPADIPDDILAQLGNRVQHALRAFTPKEQKAVKIAAQTFRANPAFKTETAISELATGVALVSMLEKNGSPAIVDRVKIRPPASRLGPLSTAEREQLRRQSPLAGQYERVIDRESAYELLAKKAEAPVPKGPWEEAGTTDERAYAQDAAKRSSAGARASHRQGYAEAVGKSVLRSVGSSVGRQIATALVRGVLGSLRR